MGKEKSNAVISISEATRGRKARRQGKKAARWRETGVDGGFFVDLRGADYDERVLAEFSDVAEGQLVEVQIVMDVQDQLIKSLSDECERMRDEMVGIVAANLRLKKHAAELEGEIAALRRELAR